MARTTLVFALAMIEAGVSFIPIRPDGSKAPAVKWTEFQHRLPSESEARQWFASGDNGIALVCGAVSGGLECMDFDDKDTLDKYIEAGNRDGLADLMKQHVLVKTPDAGMHFWRRVVGPMEGNLKLAMKIERDLCTGDPLFLQNEDGEPILDRAGKPRPRVATLIETRAEGGYALVPPSPLACHPSGRPYVQVRGSFADLPLITGDDRELLLDLARSFNECFPSDVPVMPTPPHSNGPGLRPGDDYDLRGDPAADLRAHRWTLVGPHGQGTAWRRPDKDKGISATLGYNGNNLFRCFSSNAAPFETDRSYTPFNVYTTLNHGGDFHAAARALAAQGYGSNGAMLPPSPLPGAAPTPEPSLSPEPDAEHFTDDGNARRLIRLHGQDLRYCYPWRQWLLWDQKRWAKDDTGEIVRRAKTTIRALYSEAARTEDPDRRKSLVKWALSSESETRLRHLVDLARPECPVLPAALDVDQMLFNVLNGTLDLSTLTLRPHDPADMMTRMAPVAYDSDATCPEWDRFLDIVMASNREMIEYLHAAIGYSLTGDTSERCLFVLHGSGANGKSTFLECVRSMLGDYSLRTHTSSIMARRDKGIPNDIARLKGARFVYASEAGEDRPLDEELIKEMTGGEEVSARFLHAEWFQFKPEFKLWLGTNHKPNIRGVDAAIWSRIRLIPFNVCIPDVLKEDQLLDRRVIMSRLLAERPGILARAVEGLRRWRQEGLVSPPNVAEATAGYREEMDTLCLFFSDCCTLNSEIRVPSKDLYAAYKTWCEHSGEHPLSSSKFSSRLKERGISSHTISSRSWWYGIAITPQYGESEAPG